MLLIFKPFKKGDFIETSGISGTVTQMGLVVLELRTGDNKTVLVPNSNVFSSTITNYSANETRRVDFIFDISYDDDIAQAKEIIREILEKDDRVLKEPKPVIAVSTLASSSVQIIARPWVNTPNYHAVYWQVTENVKISFDKAGISIPFNQLDVNLSGSVPESSVK